jgi:pectinesterase
MVGGGSFYKHVKEWKDASPIFWVNKNAAPVLFLNSGFPHYHAGQDEMIGIMKRLGIYTEVHGFNVKMHEFWLLHPWFDQTMKFTVTFLNKKLK